LGHEVVNLVTAHLVAMGYTVETTSHKAHFDLLVNGTLRIEVKAANWTQRACKPQYGRYKANLRKNRADLFIMACNDGCWRFFIIPSAEIRSRSLEITSYDVSRYTGQYAPFLERWGLIDQTAAAVAGRTRQLELSEGMVIKTTPKQKPPKSPGAIRLRIRFLYATWGGSMSAWPTSARLEFLRLSQALRQLESSKPS
jgi:hypothetical protein